MVSFEKFAVVYGPAVGLQGPSVNMRRLAICREAPPRCLKKPIDGFGDSPYTDSQDFSRRVQHARGPVVRWLQGPHGVQRGPFALDQRSQLAQGAPAEDRVLIRAPNTSKELSSLQKASYVYQGNSLRRLNVGGQKVLAGAPLSLTGEFMHIAHS